MSQTDVVTVLKIETGESENTIKSIKKEISDLKKVLEGAEIGSEAFEKASRDLAAAQQQLKTVMDSTKQTVSAAEGSYDALVATMAQLKKEWRATADEAKRDEIGKQIEAINTELKELDATLGNHQRNIGNYKGDIIEAYQEIQGEVKRTNDFIAGSAKPMDTVTEAAYDYGKAWSEVQKSTEQTRAKFESVQKMASGVASGFAAVQGAAALLGGENENLQKTFVKVQAAMAIAQGIGGLKDLIEGFTQAKTAFNGAVMGCKAFIGSLSGVKKAIMATGIGVLVVAVGTLIAYWDDLVDMFGNSEDEIKRVKGVVDDLKVSLENFDDDNNFIVRLAEAAGKSKDEILKLRLEQAKLAYEQAQAARDKASSNYNQKRNDEWYWNGRSDELIAAEEAYNETVEIENARWDALKKVYDDISVYEVEQRTKKAEDEKKAADDRAKNAIAAAKEEKKEIEKINEETRIALLDSKNQELENLRIKYEEQLALLQKYGFDTNQLTELYDKQRLEIIKKYADEEAKILNDNTIKQYNQYHSDYQSADNNRVKDINYKYDTASLENPDMGELDQINNEILKVKELDAVWAEHYQNRIALIDEVINSGKLSNEEVVNQFLERDKLEREALDKKREYTLQLKGLENELTQYNKEQALLRKSNIVNTFSAALNSASQILSALDANMDKSNKEGFEKSKNLQIANATIQAIVGITTALAGAYTTKTGPWDIPLAYLQAATIAATTGIQIANIKKQTYDGSGSSGNLNGGVGVSPNISMADMIPINYTKDVLTDTETAELNKQNKVYVVEESDITETQRNVKVKEDNASF